jgi:hypothetical protein
MPAGLSSGEVCHDEADGASDRVGRAGCCDRRYQYGACRCLSAKHERAADQRYAAAQHAGRSRRGGLRPLHSRYKEPGLLARGSSIRYGLPRAGCRAGELVQNAVTPGRPGATATSEPACPRRPAKDAVVRLTLPKWGNPWIAVFSLLRMDLCCRRAQTGLKCVAFSVAELGKLRAFCTSA